MSTTTIDDISNDFHSGVHISNLDSHSTYEELTNNLEGSWRNVLKVYEFRNGNNYDKIKNSNLQPNVSSSMNIHNANGFSKSVQHKKNGLDTLSSSYIENFTKNATQLFDTLSILLNIRQ